MNLPFPRGLGGRISSWGDTWGAFNRSLEGYCTRTLPWCQRGAWSESYPYRTSLEAYLSWSLPDVSRTCQSEWYGTLMSAWMQTRTVSCWCATCCASRVKAYPYRTGTHTRTVPAWKHTSADHFLMCPEHAKVNGTVPWWVPECKPVPCPVGVQHAAPLESGAMHTTWVSRRHTWVQFFTKPLESTQKQFTLPNVRYGRVKLGSKSAWRQPL